MINRNTIDNIIAISPVALYAIFVGLGIDLNITLDIKLDTIVLVLGNLAIALFITAVLSRRHKNQELKIENCFKELVSFEELIKELREIDNTLMQNDSFLNRITSLTRLQIELISKYPFIQENDIQTLKKWSSQLDKELTGSQTVDQNYKNTIVQIEKRILVIKSNILD